MNSIVFQEMREARSLAYSAAAVLSSPNYKDDDYAFFTYIATQNDKLDNALDGFEEIIEDMPQSQTAFNLAKEGLDSRLRTERIIKDNVAWSYIDAQDLGETTDDRKVLYEALPTLTLDDIVKFQQEYVKGRTYNIAILGRVEDLDLDSLGKRGRVVLLTQEDIFGY